MQQSVKKPDINTKEASEILGVPLSTLAYWRYKNIGPYYFKIGKRIFYEKEEIEKIITNSKVMTSPI